MEKSTAKRMPKDEYFFVRFHDAWHRYCNAKTWPESKKYKEKAGYYKARYENIRECYVSSGYSEKMAYQAFHKLDSTEAYRKNINQYRGHNKDFKAL